MTSNLMLKIAEMIQDNARAGVNSTVLFTTSGDFFLFW
jgi:hypothetical protein